jgi:hypothetical protein
MAIPQAKSVPVADISDLIKYLIATEAQGIHLFDYQLLVVAVEMTVESIRISSTRLTPCSSEKPTDPYRIYKNITHNTKTIPNGICLLEQIVLLTLCQATALILLTHNG